jgi:hypothetical protein
LKSLRCWKYLREQNDLSVLESPVLGTKTLVILPMCNESRTGRKKISAFAVGTESKPRRRRRGRKALIHLFISFSAPASISVLHSTDIQLGLARPPWPQPSRLISTPYPYPASRHVPCSLLFRPATQYPFGRRLPTTWRVQAPELPFISSPGLSCLFAVTVCWALEAQKWTAHASMSHA